MKVDLEFFRPNNRGLFSTNLVWPSELTSINPTWHLMDITPDHMLIFSDGVIISEIK